MWAATGPRTVYRFTWSGVTPARMAARQVSALPDWVPVSIIPQTIRFERDRSYYSTYDLPRDADHLFDDPLYANAAVPVAGTTYTLTLRYLAAARTAQLRASFHGGAALDQAPDQPIRWRKASNRQTPAATETLRLSTAPAMGMRTSSSQCLRVSWRMPAPSAPSTSAHMPKEPQTYRP